MRLHSVGLTKINIQDPFWSKLSQMAEFFILYYF